MYGRPIQVPRNEHFTPEDVDRVHSQYIGARKISQGRFVCDLIERDQTVPTRWAPLFRLLCQFPSGSIYATAELQRIFDENKARLGYANRELEIL